MLNGWISVFLCLSVQELNIDTVCSHCAPKITSVVPVYVMLENCVSIHLKHHGIIGQRGLNKAFAQVTLKDPCNVTMCSHATEVMHYIKHTYVSVSETLHCKYLVKYLL